jgi:hypothetical protein
LSRNHITNDQYIGTTAKDRSSDNHIGGCNPFAVTLKAQVEYADTFYWKIGNEAELYGENPSYIFDQTGRYYIRLYVGGPGTGR